MLTRKVLYAALAPGCGHLTSRTLRKQFVLFVCDCPGLLSIAMKRP